MLVRGDARSKALRRTSGRQPSNGMRPRGSATKRRPAKPAGRRAYFQGGWIHMNENSRGISRRDLLKFGGVAALGVVGAGALTACSSKDSALAAGDAEQAAGMERCTTAGHLRNGIPSFLIKPEPITDIAETYDYDVVVVGAGAAGVPAALSAREAGASVALLQKQLWLRHRPHHERPGRRPEPGEPAHRGQPAPPEPRPGGAVGHELRRGREVGHREVPAAQRAGHRPGQPAAQPAHPAHGLPHQLRHLVLRPEAADHRRRHTRAGRDRR